MKRLRYCLLLFASVSQAFAEDGRVIEQYNYWQTTSGNVVPDNNAPYSFYVSLNTGDGFSTGVVLLAASSPYTPNPITVVASNQIVGSYYVYEVPYPSISNLDTSFPTGTYTFVVSQSGSILTAQVSLLLIPYPTSVPTLTNPNWSDDGKLVLDPNNPRMSWSNCSGKWELDLWNNGGAGAEGGSPCPSSIVWPGLTSNTTYQATLSTFNASSTVVVTNALGSQYTFIAEYGQVVNFSIITTGVTASCSYQVENYPPDWTFDDAGGNGLIAIYASNECCWSVSATDSWIAVGNFGQGTSGCGSGTVSYTVEASGQGFCFGPFTSNYVIQASTDLRSWWAETNFLYSGYASGCPLPRTGTTFVDGQAFVITQTTTNTAPQITLAIGSPAWNTNGFFNLVLSAPSNPPLSFDFSDPAATNHSQLFYRAYADQP